MNASAHVDMRKAVTVALMFWFPIQDLALSGLYAVTGLQLVGGLAHVRDVAVLIMALLALKESRIPKEIRASIMVYGLLVFAAVPLGLYNGAPLGVVLASAAILLLPPMLVLAGCWAHRSWQDFDRSLKILIFMASASAAFGAWDIGNTSFWTDIVSFPKYMMDIKGVTVLDSDTLLPMNFFHNVEGNNFRRAAGLLAAPLGQGSFLATMGLLALAWFYKSTRIVLGALIFALCAFGVEQTDTRGALIYLGVSLAAYVIALADTPKKLRIALVGSIVVGAIFVALEWRMLLLTFTLGEFSALGHAQDLLENIMNIGSVALIGNGVGMAGAYAGFATGVSDFGGYGGESAVFSMAYQLGVPGAIVFLVFFTFLLQYFWRARKTMPQQYSRVAAAIFALGIGSTTTFISSEHIYTFSGFAQYWLLVGGFMGVACRRRPLVSFREPTQTAVPSVPDGWVHCRRCL